MKLNKALFFSVKHGRSVKDVSALIERGAKPWVVDDKGRTLLHYAAEQGNLKLINYLAGKLKINPNIQDYAGQTAMHMAATQFYGNVITALVNAGGDVNATDKLGVRPLHIAAVHGHIPVASKLIKKGADIFARSYAIRHGYSSLTAKEAAIVAHQPEMADILNAIEEKQIRQKMKAEQAPAPVFICSHDTGTDVVATKENQRTKA